MGVQLYRSHSTNGEMLFEYNYGVPFIGIASWEVDVLLREAWLLKLREVIQLIERIIKLAKFRKMIAFPIEVCFKSVSSQKIVMYFCN